MKFYTNTGARLIIRRGSRYYLAPEVIEFSKLRDRNINFSNSDIRFVTQIRYDTQSQRDQKLVFEDVWNYSSIHELTSVNQITTVSSTTTTETRDFRNTYSRRDNYRRDDYRRDDYRRDDYRRDDYRRDNYRRDGYKRRGKFYSSKAFRYRNWDGFFKVARLINRRKESLVFYVDTYNRYDVKKAYVVYHIYARRNRKWVRLYKTKKKKLDYKKGRKYGLKPTVVELKKLKLRNPRRFYNSDLRFVAEIKYKGKRKRDRVVLVENVWNYRSLTKINSVREITYSRSRYNRRRRYDD